MKEIQHAVCIMYLNSLGKSKQFQIWIEKKTKNLVQMSWSGVGWKIGHVLSDV